LFFVLYCFVLGLLIPNKNNIVGIFISKKEQYDIKYLENENHLILNLVVSFTIYIQNILILILMVSWHLGFLVSISSICLVKFNIYFAGLNKILYISNINLNEFYHNNSIYIFFYIFVQLVTILSTKNSINNLIQKYKRSNNNVFNNFKKHFKTLLNFIDNCLIPIFENSVLIVPNLIMYLVWFISYSQPHHFFINYDKFSKISLIDNYALACKSTAFIYIVIVLFGILVLKKRSYKIIYGIITYMSINIWTLFYLNEISIKNTLQYNILKNVPFYNPNIPNFKESSKIVYDVLITSNIIFYLILICSYVFYTYLYLNRIKIIGFLKPKIPKIRTTDNVAKDILKQFDKEKQ
jgi:hypothetical protein